MSLQTAKDLTRECPRGPFDTLGGYPWLPRLVDKVRAMLAGTLGDYVPFPCPADQRFLTAVGITPAAMRDRLQAGAGDAEVLAWVTRQASPETEARLRAFRDYLEAPSRPEREPALQAAKAVLAAARPDLDLSGVDSFISLICVEEGHALPQCDPGPREG